MQAGCWIALFRRVPTAQHDNLVVVTTTNNEVMVQKIVRLEEDYVILRGRLTGSTDQGRLLLIPYDQLNYLAFHKPLLEKEIQAIFGAPSTETEFAQVAQTAASEEQPLAETPLEEELDEEEVVETAPSTKPKPPSKSILLARLRERLAGGDRG